jgi:small multidrug resistance family-3 protein
LHPTAAARTYAAYGAVYIAVAILWLWLVEGQAPTTSDLVGAAVALIGMAIIVAGSRSPVE